MWSAHAQCFFNLSWVLVPMLVGRVSWLAFKEADILYRVRVVAGIHVLRYTRVNKFHCFSFED